MLESKLNSQLHLRFAKSEDIPVLVKHHCLMFEEILTLKGLNIDNATFKKIETSHNDKLEKQLSDGSCVAWLIEYNKDIVDTFIQFLKLLSKIDKEKVIKDVYYELYLRCEEDIAQFKKHIKEDRSEDIFNEGNITSGESGRVSER